MDAVTPDSALKERCACAADDLAHRPTRAQAMAAVRAVAHYVAEILDG